MKGKGAHPVLRATLWMVGTLASFMAMAVGGRELSAELNTFQILFFRSVVGLAVIALLLTVHGWAQVRTRRLGLHAVRNVAHFGGQFGWFYGLAFLPLAEVFAIEFTTPVWTALLASLLLGERFTTARGVVVVLGMAGVLLIVRPGLAVVHPAAIAVLLSALGYALSHTLTKKLAATETPLAILFYMTLIQLPLGFVPAAFDWAWPSAGMWPWLLVVGLTAMSAHYCMVRAFAHADAMVVVPLDFLRLPLIALVGFVFYGERIEWLVFAGAALILAGNLYNLRAERRAGAAARPAPARARAARE
ncbi:MAG TPA: DMT family transporter [Burkholderiales bacterium]